MSFTQPKYQNTQFWSGVVQQLAAKVYEQAFAALVISDKIVVRNRFGIQMTLYLCFLTDGHEEDNMPLTLIPNDNYTGFFLF